jgi:CheY-like chemotaxis protein
MKKILFIDDDFKRVDSHAEMMRVAGYEVNLQESAEGALEGFRTRKEDHDVVILDMMMPRGEFTQEETRHGRVTGLVLLEKLREISKDIPVIVLTVVRDPRVMEKAREFGADEYLLKPVFPSALIKAIERVIADRMGGVRG